MVCRMKRARHGEYVNGGNPCYRLGVIWAHALYVSPYTLSIICITYIKYHVLKKLSNTPYIISVYYYYNFNENY